jgi:hypothetical protein
MAKGKTGKSDFQKSVKAGIGERRESELDKALRFYEEGAKEVLRGMGYTTKSGSWVEGYDADLLSGQNVNFLSADCSRYFFEKIKPMAQKAVAVLISVGDCRLNACRGNLEEAVLSMEAAVRNSYAIKLKIRQKIGGLRLKPERIGMQIAVAELYDEGYNTARGLWDYLKRCSLKREPYETSLGATIVFEEDKATGEGFLRCGDGQPIRFRTFQNYLTEEKKFHDK